MQEAGGEHANAADCFKSVRNCKCFRRRTFAAARQDFSNCLTVQEQQTAVAFTSFEDSNTSGRNVAGMNLCLSNYGETIVELNKYADIAQHHPANLLTCFHESYRNINCFNFPEKSADSLVAFKLTRKRKLDAGHANQWEAREDLAPADEDGESVIRLRDEKNGEMSLLQLSTAFVNAVQI